MNRDVLKSHIRKAPFLKFLLWYIIGIIIGNLIHGGGMPFALVYFAFGMSIVFFICCFIFFFLSFLRAFAIILLLIMAGIWQTTYHSPFYKNYNLKDDGYEYFIGDIVDEPIETEKAFRFPVMIVRASIGETWETVDEKVMLTLMKDSTQMLSPQYGDRLYFKNRLRSIALPYNPGQFDYRKYLSNKNIYHQQFLRNYDYTKIDSAVGNPILAFALLSRSLLVTKFKEYLPDERTFQICTALIFGYRSEMDAETQRAFTNTGTVHVLSVSGMHVGLIFSLLMFLTRRISGGKKMDFKYLLILLLIWCYVVFTGLAPSTLRAGIMISFYIVGKWMQRPSHILNTLFGSAFFILLWDAKMIFDIGFQLSFLAVLGIVLFFPLMKRVFMPKDIWLKRIVEYSYISIAAQLFTAPIAIWYFGQFPNYFLLANLILVIPASMIMYGGILLSVMPLPYFSLLLGKLLIWITTLTFQGLTHIDRLPYASITGIEFSGFQMIVMTFIVLCLTVTLQYRLKYVAWAGCFLCFIFVLTLGLKKLKRTQHAGIYLYNVGSNFVLAGVHGEKVRLISDLESMEQSAIQYNVASHLKQYASPENISLVTLNATSEEGMDQSNSLQINLFDKTFYVIKSLDFTAVPDSIDVAIIRHNVVKEVDRLKSLVKARMFILDGSNSDISIRNMEEGFRSAGDSVYILKNNFAYVWLVDQ